MPKKKTPKKPSELPDDSSGNASPSAPDAGADESKGEEEQESEVSFGSINEHEANEFLNRVETMYEKQHGPLPDGESHISLEAREAFVEMYPRLRITNYDDEALVPVADLLILGVNKVSLMQQLPALSKGVLFLRQTQYDSQRLRMPPFSLNSSLFGKQLFRLLRRSSNNSNYKCRKMVGQLVRVLARNFM